MSSGMKYELFDRPIAFHSGFKKPTGSTNAALLVSQMIYWSNRTTNPDGWFYKTAEEFEDETKLTRKEQLKARNILKNLGWLEEKLKGIPATLYFRLTETFDDYLKSSFYFQSNQVCTSSQNLIDLPVKTISENTSKITTNPPKAPRGGDVEGFFKSTKKEQTPAPEKKKGFTDAYVLEQLERLVYKWNKRADKYGTYYRRVRVVNTSYNMAAVKKLLQECKKLGFDWEDYISTAMDNIAKTMAKYHNKSTQASEYFNFLFAIRATQFNILYEGVKNFVIDREPSRFNRGVEEEGISQAVGENDPRNPYGRKSK